MLRLAQHPGNCVATRFAIKLKTEDRDGQKRRKEETASHETLPSSKSCSKEYISNLLVLCYICRDIYFCVLSVSVSTLPAGRNHKRRKIWWQRRPRARKRSQSRPKTEKMIQEETESHETLPGSKNCSNEYLSNLLVFWLWRYLFLFVICCYLSSCVVPCLSYTVSDLAVNTAQVCLGNQCVSTLAHSRSHGH